MTAPRRYEPLYDAADGAVVSLAGPVINGLVSVRTICGEHRVIPINQVTPDRPEHRVVRAVSDALGVAVLEYLAGALSACIGDRDKTAPLVDLIAHQLQCSRIGGAR